MIKINTYKEAEKYFEGQTNIKKGDFYYYCAFNLWTFELNREPDTEGCPLPLKWKSIDSFYDFFATIPKNLSFRVLFEKAEEFYEKSLADCVEDKKNQADIYMKLNLVYDYLNKHNQVKDALKQAEKLFRELEDKKGLLSVYLQYAYAERFRTYDMKKAEEYLWQAYHLAEKLSDKGVMASCLLKIADIYHPDSVEGANIGLWEKYNNDAVKLFIELNYISTAHSILLTMADAFEKIDNMEKHAAYLKKAKELEDK
jgi:tetratricopeptide (TPR) repeat protein